MRGGDAVPMAHDVERAAASRDAAAARVRRLTAGAVTAGVALTAAFASLAAGSTHLRKTIVHRVRPATPVQKAVTAPAAPLVAVHSSAPAPAPPAASSPAPSVSSSPPVVVSGGS